MSREDVEIVRAAFDAYRRGDEAAWLALAAPDVVVTQFADQLDARDYHGQEGLREVMAEWTDAWDDWTIELVDAREVDSCVLATARQQGRGKASGVPMESEVVFVFTMRRAAIVRWQMFHTEQQALEAVRAQQ